ncbi:MAG: hypothetical protein JXR37_10790 [Kiritimatiellae bacterium]|nr:hypothetical protein [Kiritimatiellia bacterium]
MKKKTNTEFGRAIANVIATVDPDPRVAEDVRNRIHADLRATGAPEIMDMYDLAHYLKVGVEDVEQMLDQLPHFEFAGKIRFRKVRIEQWLSERERVRKRDQDMSDLQSWKRFSTSPVRLEVIA